MLNYLIIMIDKEINFLKLWNLGWFIEVKCFSFIILISFNYNHISIKNFTWSPNFNMAITGIHDVGMITIGIYVGEKKYEVYSISKIHDGVLKVWYNM